MRKDGSFTFSYAGEIVFLSPGDLGPGTRPSWSDGQARCFEENPEAETDVDAATDRPCSAREIAEQRKSWETEQAAKAREETKKAAEFGAMFGYTPGDDAANKRLAATMMRYDGWKSVTYKGNGVFDVVYEAKGRLDHDFVFPLIPQNTMILPFVTIRRQDGDKARINAPGFVANPGRSMMAGMKSMGPGGGSGGPDDDKLGVGRAQGSFTITTDGDIRTNNTENGPEKASQGQRLEWRIDANTAAAPEALIQLR